MTTVHLKNKESMKAYAKTLVDRSFPGTVIGLIGDLGAGKTTLVQFMAEELGVRRPVKSPTFLLLQEFTTHVDGPDRGVRRLWHADAYRIEREREMWSVGLDEAVADPDAVTVVEWADRLPKIKTLPGYKEISITFGEGDERIVIEDPEPPHREGQEG
jgi:tRNA threonylcarbamoyladenosine biosynthesis protein TsaE